VCWLLFLFSLGSLSVAGRERRREIKRGGVLGLPG